MTPNAWTEWRDQDVDPQAQKVQNVEQHGQRNDEDHENPETKIVFIQNFSAVSPV